MEKAFQKEMKSIFKDTKTKRKGTEIQKDLMHCSLCRGFSSTDEEGSFLGCNRGNKKRWVTRDNESYFFLLASVLYMKYKLIKANERKRTAYILKRVEWCELSMWRLGD